MSDNFLINLLRPEDQVIDDGKVYVKRTLGKNYEIYLNGNLVKTIHNSSNEEPTQEEIYAALEEAGIDSDSL